MHKEFIPYEQALTLKKLGFDKPCIKGFYNKEPIYTVVTTPVDFNNKKQLGELVSAPLYQQVFKWFREKYKSNGFVIRDGGHWIAKYQDYNNEENKSPKEIIVVYKYSPEEAELECLKKLIEIVKLKTENHE